MNLTFDLQQLLLLVLSVKGQVDNILPALDGIISRLGLCFGFRSLFGLGSSLRLCSGLRQSQSTLLVRQRQVQQTVPRQDLAGEGQIFRGRLGAINQAQRAESESTSFRTPDYAALAFGKDSVDILIIIPAFGPTLLSLQDLRLRFLAVQVGFGLALRL